MKHVLLWLDTEVAHHLDGFCILKLDMLFLDHRLHEVLMDNLAQ